MDNDDDPKPPFPRDALEELTRLAVEQFARQGVVVSSWTPLQSREDLQAGQSSKPQIRPKRPLQSSVSDIVAVPAQ